LGRWIKGGNGDFPLIAAHAKLDISIGGVRETLCFPIKGMTLRAFNIHLIETMNLPRWIKGATSNREMKDNGILIIERRLYIIFSKVLKKEKYLKHTGIGAGRRAGAGAGSTGAAAGAVGASTGAGARTGTEADTEGGMNYNYIGHITKNIYNK